MHDPQCVRFSRFVLQTFLAARGLGISLFFFAVLFGAPAFAQQNFPQIAVGGDPSGGNFQTIAQMVNNNSVMATGTMNFFQDSGAGLDVLVNGAGPQVSFPFSLEPGEARQYVLTRSGGIVAGWMRVSFTSVTDASVNVIFQLRNGTTVLSEAGVLPASGISTAQLVFDSQGPNLDTGIAFANQNTTARTVNVIIKNPDTGADLGTATVNLAPNGHEAKFITQLFPNVPNINEMRAQIAISVSGSGNTVLAMALRVNSAELTTIPIGSSSSGTQVLPQVAFGGSPNSTNMKTIIYLTTTSSSGVSGTAEVFDDNGQPLAVSADGAAPATTFAFNVSQNRTQRIILSGDATLRSGWVRFSPSSSSPSYIVSAVFQIFDASTLLSEAGVLASPSVTRGMSFVEARGGSTNTGIAIINRSTTAQNTITIRLYDRQGRLLATATITLAPNGHSARFVTEIFQEIFGKDGSTDGAMVTSNGDPQAISDFDGSISITGSTSFSVTALRLNGGELTTIPVPQRGLYAPVITNLRVVSTQRSPARVTVEINVVDMDADLVTNSSTSVSAFFIMIFSNTIVFGTTSFSGASLLNQTSGTIQGSVSPGGSVSGGGNAGLILSISDKAGNSSNSWSTTVTF